MIHHIIYIGHWTEEVATFIKIAFLSGGSFRNY